MRTTDKPFNITKKQVYEAYKAVKSNGGAAGVDKQTIEQFEADLQNNLYKLWNRMSSGSYFPPAVRAVPIPKKSGGQRILGVPTVADRVAQMVVKQLIEPDLESVFLANSYGYRPGKSALQAVGVTRERCWKYNWVLEFDIKGLFDNIDHELLLRAVRKHVTCKWALLYIERWLTAPMEQEDGSIAERKRGTPQGGVLHPSDNSAKLPFDFSVRVPRTQLRPRYGDGFDGAPLTGRRPRGEGRAGGGGADDPARSANPASAGAGKSQTTRYSSRWLAEAFERLLPQVERRLAQPAEPSTEPKSDAPGETKKIRSKWACRHYALPSTRASPPTSRPSRGPSPAKWRRWKHAFSRTGCLSNRTTVL